jgi:arylformamidase
MTASTTASRLLDISPRLRAGMSMWPGDAPFHFSWTSRMRGGAAANVGAISLSTHAGAHVDAPLHVIEHGTDVASVALEAFWGPARVFDVEGLGRLDAAALGKLDWDGVERALLRTQAAAACLAEDAAAFLATRGVRLIGIDSLSVDAPDDDGLPVHRALAAAGIAILECLVLEAARAGDYELAALPLALAGADASPVRAVLRAR